MSSRPPLVLSIFPGIDMLGMAFEEQGMCVVRGPDLIWGGDIRAFHPPDWKFAGVIGGPPCQAYSQFRHINPHCGRHGDLIPEFCRVVSEARPVWFLMENVKAAPEPVVEGYDTEAVLLRDHWVGGNTERLRRFTFGRVPGTGFGRFEPELLALHTMDERPAVTSAREAIPVALGGNGKPKKSLAKHGGRGTRSIPDMLEDQGLPRDFLADCPLTSEGIRRLIGNGVPLALGRAVAKAVARALRLEGIRLTP